MALDLKILRLPSVFLDKIFIYCSVLPLLRPFNKSLKPVMNFGVMVSIFLFIFPAVYSQNADMSQITFGISGITVCRKSPDGEILPQ